jgi:hypothetical protein
MRRISIFFALLCAATGISALSASSAGATHLRGDTTRLPGKPPAPAGWALVEGDRAAIAHGTHTSSAAAPRALVRSLRFAANTRYVSAELGYQGQDKGMLRARATAPRSWERFDLLWDPGSDAYALRSRANQRYVSVELDAHGRDHAMLRAAATGIGERERFYLYRNARSGMYSMLSKANARWTSVHLGHAGRDHAMLRASATEIGPREQFEFV